MALTNPAIFGAATKLATRAASSLADLQYLGAELQNAFSSATVARADCSATHDVSGELGYGCVDWFIYVTDPNDAATVAQAATV